MRRLQGEGLDKCLGGGNKNIVYVNGSPSDSNATLFAAGAHQALDPKTNYKVVAEQPVPDWDNQQAGTIYEQIEARGEVRQRDSHPRCAPLTAQAIAREVREEYGIEIEVLGLLDVVNHLIPEERQHWVSPTFLCRIVSGTPRIREPHKCDEIGWFAIDAIPEENLSLASKKSLSSLRTRNKLKR